MKLIRARPYSPENQHCPDTQQQAFVRQLGLFTQVVESQLIMSKVPAPFQAFPVLFEARGILSYQVPTRCVGISLGAVSGVPSVSRKVDPAKTRFSGSLSLSPCHSSRAHSYTWQSAQPSEKEKGKRTGLPFLAKQCKLVADLVG